MPSPRVSVIVPCHNCADTIEATLDSVLAQSAAPQVIAIDDGSTDATPEILARYADRIEIERIRNSGVIAARNRALERVETPYVAFLDSDDRYEGQILAGALAAAEAADADLVISRERKSYSDGTAREVDCLDRLRDHRSLMRAWFSPCQTSQSALFFRTAFMRRIGGWNPRIEINHDGELVLRAARHAPRVATNRLGIAVYRKFRSDSLSSKWTEAKIVSFVREVGGLCRRLSSEGYGNDVAHVYPIMYWMVRWLYESDHVASGRWAERFLRDEGFTGHDGSVLHTLVARIIGLEKKVALTKRLRGRPLG